MSLRAVHPVTNKIEPVKLIQNRFKLKVIEFPNGEEFPADTITIVCNTCEQEECACLRVA